MNAAIKTCVIVISGTSFVQVSDRVKQMLTALGETREEQDNPVFSVTIRMAKAVNEECVKSATVTKM